MTWRGQRSSRARGDGAGVRQRGVRARGTAYLLVVSSGALLAAAAVGAAAVLSARSREAGAMDQGEDARAAAQAGLEIASELLRRDPSGASWRELGDRNLLADRATALDGTVFSLTIEPETGDPRLVGSMAPIVVRSSATVGDWTRTLRAVLDPTLANLPALAHPLVVADKLVFDGKRVSGAGTILTNGSAEAVSATIELPIAAGEHAGGTFVSGVTTLATPYVLPNPSIVDEYAARGTRIRLTQLTSNQLRRVVLSAGSNPFGSVNAAGIYVLDCQGQDISVSEVRVLGTLVLLNPGPNSAIRDHAFFEAAAPEQPVLLVGGSIRFGTSAGDLSEASISTNLNPSGAAHAGVVDSDTADFYPSMFEGIVYVRDDLKSTGFTTVEGTLIVGGSASFSEDAVFRAFPPDRVVVGMSEPGSWRLRSVERVVR